jgi:hypothetical protein
MHCLVPDQGRQADRGSERKSTESQMKKWIGAVVLLLLIAGLSSKESKPTATPAMPTTQAQLVSVVAQYQDLYNKAVSDANDVQQNVLADARSKRLCGMNTSAKDWVGEVYQVSTGFSRQNEGASLTVKIGNHKNTFWLKTRIKASDPLFSGLSSLNRGDKIQFSGEMLLNDKGCFIEFRFTQSGSMTDPEFAFRFTKIEKVQ